MLTAHSNIHLVALGLLAATFPANAKTASGSVAKAPTEAHANKSAACTGDRVARGGVADCCYRLKGIVDRPIAKVPTLDPMEKGR